MEEKGIVQIELLSLEMKLRGLYLAHKLSFENVTVEFKKFSLSSKFVLIMIPLVFGSGYVTFLPTPKQWVLFIREKDAIIFQGFDCGHESQIYVKRGL